MWHELHQEVWVFLGEASVHTSGHAGVTSNHVVGAECKVDWMVNGNSLLMAHPTPLGLVGGEPEEGPSRGAWALRGMRGARCG